MALPNAKMKINKDGVRFESNVEAVEYSIVELTRAALRDSAKLIRKRVGQKLVDAYKSTYTATRKGNLIQLERKGRLEYKYPRKAAEYWVRKKETDLLIGFKKNAWYGSLQELGDKGFPKLGILRNTVYENVDEIRKIQARYLTALNEEKPSIPSEGEYKNEEGDE